MHGINPEEHEYIPIPLQNRQKFDFYNEKLARRNEEIEKRGKLSLTVEERKIWLTKLRLQTRDIVNSTSIGTFSNIFQSGVRLIIIWSEFRLGRYAGVQILIQ